ncbi:MAG TPA: HypC/HybG/HupF family hydrogenase formation chaperone [bacterium]|nr:HypC/HybG/HupF family hydrogenase formation chaperone [bacterium]
MCLAVPVKIIEILDIETAIFDIDGVGNEVNISLVEDLEPGDYVLVHAGFAIEKLDREEALKTLEMFEEIARETGMLSADGENL